jgi:acyl-CoA thioesterase FadM
MVSCMVGSYLSCWMIRLGGRKSILCFYFIPFVRNQIDHDSVILFTYRYEAMCMNQGLFSLYSEEENGDLPYVVTANLNVNYRAPLPAGSDVVIRVRHEKTDGRKIFYSARMESHDGSVLYSESTALFITVQKQYLKN